MKTTCWLAPIAWGSACTAAAAHFPTTADLNTAPPVPLSTVCGKIVAANQNLTNPYYWFPASIVKDCLTSVPFNAAVASSFVAYYNQTLQFQSTTAFLRNPPSGYQQPAYDLFANLAQIQNRIDAGYYLNQYAFDADFQTLQLGAHDTHVGLYAGALSQFTFSAPFYIATVSSDGKELPQVYVWADVYNYTTNDYTASPIESLNGVPVVEFLETFASQQSFGMLEPDADWNQMMFSPAQQISGQANALTGGATFYPGDHLEVAFKNGSKIHTFWLALYNSPGFTGPLETGGDFYNFFVLGNFPADWNTTWKAYYEEYRDYLEPIPASDDSDEGHSLKSWHPVSPAYPPDTIVAQKSLGYDLPGCVTGYYYSDISTAVLSIPSFEEFGSAIGTFSETIVDFIQNATDQPAKHIIIDLQQNGGGQESLAYDAFRQFFPAMGKNSSPSRMRSHLVGNQLGNILTPYFQNRSAGTNIYGELIDEEWVITDRINAETGKDFASWGEFEGPLVYNSDNFSLYERYNLSSRAFDSNALGIVFPKCYYDNTCVSPTQWSGSDIVLLTDGFCGSACSLFVELMTYEGGARTVVIGGRPQDGPMQAASGSRGALAYTTDEIETSAAAAHYLNKTAPLDYSTNTGGTDVGFAGINLRDQIRLDSNGVPNQFLYLPADCRLYWTLANVNNYTRLWRDTWSAVYNDTSMCVPGSSNATAPLAPKPNEGFTADSTVLKGQETDSNGGGNHNPLKGLIPGFLDGDLHEGSVALTFCDGKDGAEGADACTGSSARCMPFLFPCMNSTCSSREKCHSAGLVRHICMTECRNLGSGPTTCSGFETCNPVENVNSKAHSGIHKRGLFSQSLGRSVQNFGEDVFRGDKDKDADGDDKVYTAVQSGYCQPRLSSHVSTQCRNLDSNSKLQSYVQNGKRRRR